MRSKVFNVKNERGLMKTVIATEILANTEKEKKVLEVRGFYGESTFILLTDMDNHTSTTNPYSWDNSDLFQAHTYIRNNFSEIESGETLLVEEIRKSR